MRLSDYELIPSVVQDTNDPECLGRIKCVIPGKIHDNSTKTTAQMPWVKPLVMNGYQSFSKELEGHKVWVLHNKNTYNEYWYIPIHEPINITKDFLQEHYNDNPEILISRNLCGKKIMMRYDDITGYMYEIGENFINLNTDGDFEVRGSDGRIAIESGKVLLGSWSDRQYEPAVKGKTLLNKFKLMHEGVSDMLTACKDNPLPALMPGLMKLQEALSSMQEIIAVKTFLN